MALSKELKAALAEAFGGREGNSGTNAGPGRAAIRGLLRDGKDAGLSDAEVLSFLNPGFYRAVADPYGGGQLLEDLDPRTLHNLAKYAATKTGEGTNQGSVRDIQEDFFKAFPDMQALYVELAG
jgi:hypothetical protein